MTVLKFTSCMAPSMDPACRRIVAYLGARLAIDTAFVDDIPWAERERRLDAGELHVCWICGLPYVWKANAADPPIVLIAAPVMRAARYANRPVYFSDIVVHRGSPYTSFTDLRGCRWVYNEPRSHSGYNVVRHHLARLGESQRYFAKALESGAHQTSIRWIIERRADASAIDSTVLELELLRSPELGAELRAIGTLGPSPMPPWVASRTLPLRIRRELRRAMLTMHVDPAGAEILRAIGIAAFVAVRDRAYDPIRRMAESSGAIAL